MNDSSVFNETDMRQYRIADVLLFSAGEQYVLAYQRLSKNARLIHADVADFLTRCTEFKTIDEHIQDYMRVRHASPTRLRSLRREIQPLVENGYFISLDQVEALFARAHFNEPSDSAHITTVGILTCERLETFKQSMVGALQHCQDHGRSVRFVVMDDSPRRETRQAYYQLLQRLCGDYDAPIAYAGLEEKKAFAQALSQATVIPMDVLSFAFVGEKRYGLTTIGANRNALLLQTLGECLLSADDDISWRVVHPPNRQEGLAFMTRGTPAETWFYADRAQALDMAHFVDQDLLALHETWLGRSPGEARGSIADIGSISYYQADPETLRRLSTQPGRVALSITGTLGDCSWDNFDHHLFLQGASFQRLTDSEQAYHQARTSREMLQAPRQVVLTDRSASFFSMCIGLDNRDLLPPFTPVGRAEDIAFGMMLNTCFRDLFMAHLPWAVVHTPPNERTYTHLPIFEAGFNSWLPSCIGLFDHGFTKSPAERLKKLGEFFKELGQLPEQDFDEFVRVHMWQNLSSISASLEERFRHPERPILASWARDAQTFLEKARQRALAPVGTLYSQPGGRATLQHLLVRFGSLLAWWPTIVEAARSLHAQGIHLARPVRV